MVIRKSVTYLSHSALLFAQILLTIAALAALTQAQTPVGYWKFDDGAGTHAVDSSGSGHTAILGNGVSWVPGKVGGALAANGARQPYVKIPAIDLSETPAATIAFWSKRTYSTGGGHALFEATSNYSNSTTGFAFFPDDETCAGIQIALRGNLGSVADCYAQPSSGEWHHLAVVFDKSQTGADEIKFYVDGALQTATRNLDAATNTNNFGNNPIYLFSRAATTNFDSGVVDELRIFNTALTAEQIQQILTDPGSGTITLDGNVHGVHDNGLAASSTTVVSIGTPTAGDLITCEVSFTSTGGNTLVSVADNNNGTYGAAVAVHLNTTLGQWYGVYYKENVAASPTTITLTTSQSKVYSAIACEAWKGVATSNSLDSAFAQLRDAVNVPNPTTGSNQTPAGNNELVIAAVGLGNAGTPTSGANYTLIDGAPVTLWWPEYWAQSTATATAGNFTWPSDDFTDMMAAFKPAGTPTLTSITVTPTNPSVAAGNQLQFTATGNYSDGSHQNLTASATWTSSAPTVATIASGGLATGVAVGTTTIQAASGTINGSTTLTVTPPVLLSITVTPADPSIAAGTQLQFTATGNYSDGSHQNLTSSSTWTSSTPSVATISSGGLAAAVAAGTTTIQAASSTINGSTILTVTPPVLLSIAVTPTNPSIQAGNQQQFTATGTYSDGSHQNLTGSVTWTSSAPSVATINSAGLATGVAAGTTTIQAALSSINGSTTLTVTGGASITLDGNVHGVHDNGLIFSTTTVVSIGTPTAGDLLTCEVSFTSTGGNTLVSVADNNNGAYGAAVPVHLNTTLGQWYGIYYKENVAASPTTITLTTSQREVYSAIACEAWKGAATSGSLDSSFAQLRDAVNVPNPTTGSNHTPATNNELVIAAVGLNNAGTPTSGANYTLIDGAPVTLWWPEYWAQTTATATAGNFTWPSDDFTDMMAAFKPAGTPTLTSITVTPANPSIAAGTQLQFTATGNYSDGSHQNLTASATWTSSAPTVATIASGGLATAVAAGTTTIQAASGTIDGSTTLTVTAAGNFTISASPASLSIASGSHGTSTITTAVSGGFNSAIALSASGMPAGTTVSFSPQTIPAPGSGSSTMTITVGSSTPTGTYPITVTGNGGGIQQSTTVTLTVTGGGATFTISASPASLNVMQGTQGSSTITTAISGGFNSAISLSASGLPAGTMVSFNPQTIPAPGSGNSTLTFMVGLNTPMGTYPITVTGNGGGVQQSVTVNLTVTAQVILSWTASTSPGIAGYNAYRSTVSGGPYTKINSSLISTTAYNDLTVQNGITYYYVTTAVNNQGMESPYSNQSSATVP